jgi:Secretion system C-terminal sorting domain
MKTTFAKFILIFTMLCIAATTFQSNSGGVVGGGVAGCNCHGNANGAAQVLLVGMPATGYVNNTAYICTLTVQNTVMVKAGFALHVSGGTINNIPANVTQVSPTEITHNTPKALNGGVTSWIFTWNAPASGTVTVDVNYAGNTVNNNNQTNGDQWNIGSMQVPAFGVVISAPVVTSNSANNITYNNATLNGTCNANNASTTLTFEYGTSTAYGQTISGNPNNINGDSIKNISAIINGLLPNTLYHFRLKGQNNIGIANGTDQTFTTISTEIADINYNKMTFAPNPCAAKLEIINALDIEYNTLQIIDWKGRIMPFTACLKNNNVIEINTINLSKGLYIINFIQNNKKTFARFEKL